MYTTINLRVNQLNVFFPSAELLEQNTLYLISREISIRLCLLRLGGLKAHAEPGRPWSGKNVEVFTKYRRILCGYDIQINKSAFIDAYFAICIDDLSYPMPILIRIGQSKLPIAEQHHKLSLLSTRTVQTPPKHAKPSAGSRFRVS